MAKIQVLTTGFSKIAIGVSGDLPLTSAGLWLDTDNNTTFGQPFTFAATSTEALTYQIVREDGEVLASASNGATATYNPTGEAERIYLHINGSTANVTASIEFGGGGIAPSHTSNLVDTLVAPTALPTPAAFPSNLTPINIGFNDVYSMSANEDSLVKFTATEQTFWVEQYVAGLQVGTGGVVELYDANHQPVISYSGGTADSDGSWVWAEYRTVEGQVYYAHVSIPVAGFCIIGGNQGLNNFATVYDTSIVRTPFASYVAPAPARSNVKFSQKSIKGLPEALAALASAVTNQGSTGATALTDAIAAEVAARNGAISTAIAQEVLDRNSAISTAVQGVLGTAPEAFDTLKEIADYIAVNPNATVADAINAAIATANLAVTNLTTAVDAEKAYSDFKSSQALRLKGEVITLTGALTDSKAAVTTVHAVEMVLNYGFARVTNIVLGETYDLPVVVNAGVASIDFAGYEAEATDLTQFTGVIQYAYKVDATTERAAFVAI